MPNPLIGKPFPSEHSCRLQDPGKYDRFARKNCEQKVDGKCLDVIYGIKNNKAEIQALRYPKKIWTAAAARSHCGGRNGSFEAAAEGEEAMYEMTTKTAEGKTELKVVSGGELFDWFKAHTDGEGNVTEEVGLFGTALFKAGGDDETVSWVISDFTLDRDKERIDPSGWDLKQYKRNPVVLWSHDVMRPAIGRVVSPRVSNGALRGKVQFAPREIDEFGWQIGQKVKAGFLNAGSVGFRPTKVEMVDPETEPKEEARAIIRKAELFEFSVCNVPANPAAQPERPEEGKGVSAEKIIEAVKVLPEVPDMVMDFEPNEETIKALEAAGRGEVETADSVEELMEKLDSPNLPTEEPATSCACADVAADGSVTVTTASTVPGTGGYFTIKSNPEDMASVATSGFLRLEENANSPLLATQEDLIKAVNRMIERMEELLAPLTKAIEEIKAQFGGAVSSEELERMIGAQLARAERERSYLHELFRGQREPTPGNLHDLYAGGTGAEKENENG